MGAISELHSFNTLALRPSGPGALCIFKPFNSLRTPLGSTAISPMGVKGLVPLHGISESISKSNQIPKSHLRRTRGGGGGGGGVS